MPVPSAELEFAAVFGGDAFVNAEITAPEGDKESPFFDEVPANSSLRSNQ